MILNNRLIILSFLILNFFSCKKAASVAKDSSNQVANIFILTGQSNALGQNEFNKLTNGLPISFLGPRKNILVGRYGNDPHIDKPFSFEPMEIPLNTRDKYYNDSNNANFFITGWSIEQNWTYWSQTYLNTEIYLLKSAFGGLSISNWQKPNGKMYLELSRMINDAINKLKNEGKEIRVRGIVWMQGEADVSTTNYYSLLDSTITWLRNINPSLQQTPFIMVKIPSTNLYFSKFANDAFDSLKIKNPKLNFVINPEDYADIKQDDHVHFNNYSKLKLGQEIYKLQLLNHQLD